MWYVVQTDIHKEDETRRLLLGLDGVRDVYLPLYRRSIRSESGVEKHHFVPTISGFLFAYVDDEKMDGLVTGWGYFKYMGKVFDPDANGMVPREVVTRAHLLCPSVAETPKEAIIAKARVPLKDIERLRIFNDRQIEGIEDLKILDLSYQVLAEENDIVMITEGPYLGIEGVIKQVKYRGRKDRRFHFSIGNWCVSVSNVRSYRHIVIREAKRGEKARAIQAWRQIDHLLGRIQAVVSADEAASKLRLILRSLNRNVRLDEYIYSLAGNDELYPFLSNLTSQETGYLISLSRYFQTYDRSIDTGLNELIPDLTLRPFLTPTAGKEIPEGQDYTTLLHDDFTEIILRIDLRPYFTLPAQSEAQDEDYTYYAHVAIIEEADGTKFAVVQWGEFIRQYLLKTTEEREAFHVDLASKGYTCLAALLAASQEKGADIYLYNENGITGFARKIESDANLAPEARHEFPETKHEFPKTMQGFPQNHACFYPKASEDLPESKRGFGLDTACLSATRSMVSAIAPTAVEMWQGTRLLSWRKLAQRYVLLHKSPSDYPEDRPC